jgi:hypothetical protein
MFLNGNNFPEVKVRVFFPFSVECFRKEKETLEKVQLRCSHLKKTHSLFAFCFAFSFCNVAVQTSCAFEVK